MVQPAAAGPSSIKIEKIQHVDKGRGHIPCADLIGDEQVAEGSAKAGRKHKEHHDGAVQGNQGHVEVGV